MNRYLRNIIASVIMATKHKQYIQKSDFLIVNDACIGFLKTLLAYNVVLLRNHTFFYISFFSHVRRYQE